MDLVVVLVVVAVVVAALAIYIFFSPRGARATARPMPAPKVAGLKLKQLAEADAVSRALPEALAPPPLFDLDLEPVILPAPLVEISWSGQFDPRSETLDETARLRLIGDLGVVAKQWCVPLLCRAYEEERRSSHRQAALIALTACHSRSAAATFRLALASQDAAERAIAADGLAELEPVAQTKPRRTVERH